MKTQSEERGEFISVIEQQNMKMRRGEALSGTVVSVDPAMLKAVDERGSREVTVSRCDNLRLRGGRLRPVTPPNVIERGDSDAESGGRLVEVVSSDRLGRIGLYDSLAGGKTGYMLLDCDTPEMVVLGVADGEMAGAVVTEPDTIVMYSPSGLYRIKIDAEGLKWIGRAGRLPEVKFEIVDEVSIESEVSERKLSGRYGRESTRLSRTDAEAMRADGEATVNALIAQGARLGKMSRPVLLRYRLTDGKGRTLYKSLPTVVAPETGINFSGESNATLNDELTALQPWKVKARVFNIKACLCKSLVDYIPEARGREEIRSLIVEVSPPLDTIDPTIPNPGYITARAGGRLTATYRPGEIAIGVGDGRHRSEALISSLAPEDDALYTTLAVIDAPWEGAEREVMLPVPVSMSRPIAENVASLKERLRGVKRAEDYSWACRLPNRFGAAVATAGAGIVAWGDITPEPYRDISIARLSCERGAQSWRGRLEIVMADGSRRVVTDEAGSSDAPLTMMPMIAYPDPAARRADITVERGGVTYMVSVPLRVTAGGAMAVYVTPDCRPIEVDTPAESVAAATKSETGCGRERGRVVTARCHNAAEGVSTVDLDSRVSALEVPPRRASAYDAGRLRLYIFTVDHISMANVDEGGRLGRLQRVDDRGVENRWAVTRTGLKENPLIAIASGDLISLSRATVKTLVGRIGRGDVAWDAADEELWVVRECDGYPRVYDSEIERQYRLTVLSAGRMFVTQRGVIVEDDERRLLDMSRGRSSQSVKVAWECAVVAPIDRITGHNKRLCGLRAEIFGTPPLPALTVGGNSVGLMIENPAKQSGSQATAQRPIITYKHTGPSQSPIIMPVVKTPPMSAIIIKIEGNASETTMIGGVNINFN